MPRKATGSIRHGTDGWETVLTLEGQKRKLFKLPTCRNEREAQDRSALLGAQIRSLRIAKRLWEETSQELILELSVATRTAPVISVISKVISGELKRAPEYTGPTFRSVADMWTSGEMHRQFPDAVKAIDHADNETRLAWVSDIVFGGVPMGDIPISEWTIEHSEHVMRNLPERVKRPAARRHYAQAMRRVLELAIYPLKQRESNPVPKGMIPSVGKPPLYPYLRPDEDAKLLACTAVPLEFRLAAGFAAREGLRIEEQASLDVQDFFLTSSADGVRGTVTIDENKTDDPRSWALSADVAEAMSAWFRVRNAAPSDPAFVDSDGRRMTANHAAARFRRALHVAGIERHALHVNGTNTHQITWHCLRGGFVTISLSSGRAESWVSDRTGHRSTLMIQRYRRRSREVSELGLGTWQPMSLAIPEIADLIRKTFRNED